MGEPVEVPTETSPQPCKASDANSAAAAMPLSFKSSRRVTMRTVIQDLMRFPSSVAEDALLKGHEEGNSLVSRSEQGSAVNIFREGLRFCEERHANASYCRAE